MNTGFKSIELARKLYGLPGDEQKTFLDALSWANGDKNANKYLQLFSKGEITREQFLDACKKIKMSN